MLNILNLYWVYVSHSKRDRGRTEARMDSASFFLLITLLHFVITLSSHTSAESIIQIPTHKIQIAGDRKIRVDDGLYCDSWRFSVETNDAGIWDYVPSRCTKFVQDYMTGDRYSSDSEVVCSYAFEFARSVNVTGDGKDAWVFDIDETLLSNLPYYEANGFGSEPFNEESFDEWVDLAEAPALPASLNFYKELKQLGFSIFLLTGRSEYQRNVTDKNLLFAGYSGWEKLFLRGVSDQGKPAIIYKSEKRTELVNEGYRIHGSSGDQWSDLLGFSVAERSFKLPNPMYYIS